MRSSHRRASSGSTCGLRTRIPASPWEPRVHFRSEHGAYLAPHGHQADVNVAWFEDMGGDCKTGGVPYAYIDGTCQIDLPIGPVYAEVVRGFEYQPLRQQVEIKPGQKRADPQGQTRL